MAGIGVNRRTRLGASMESKEPRVFAAVLVSLALAAILAVVAIGASQAQAAPSKPISASLPKHAPKYASPHKHHHPGRHGRTKATHLPRQNAGPPLPGVVVSPNGWIHYEDSPQAYLAAEAESTRAKIIGDRLPGGGCQLKDQATIPQDALEVVEEEIAYNPETCESIVEQKVSLKPPLQKAVLGSVQQAQTSGSGEIKFKSGHTKTQWVDPAEITITSVNADLTWPVGGPTAGTRGKAYQYAFAWDGWKKSGLKESTVYKVPTQDPNETIMGSKTYNYSDGWSFHANEDFTNTDFYNALHSLGVSGACSEGGVPAVFHHAVKVTGYRSGQMGYWRETTKKGACNNLVHKVERIGWGVKGPENEKVHPPVILSPIRIPTIRFSALEEEFEVGPEALPGIPVPVDTWIPESRITSNSAVLEGTVDPEGAGNVYVFQCGTTEAYGMWTSPVANAGVGTVPVGVSATVPNLAPNTTYHCRLAVLASLGDAAFGPDQAFTTRPASPTMTINPASGVTESSATVSGTMNPNGVDGRYKFECGRTGLAYTMFSSSEGTYVPVGSSPVGVSWTLNGLTPGTSYSCRLEGNSAGGVSYSSTQTFTTRQQPAVFFADAAHGGSMTRWTFDSISGWKQTPMGGDSIATGTKPATLMVNGAAHVFFVDATKNNTISEWVLDPATGLWQQNFFYGDSVAAGTSPSAIMVNGAVHVFFVDASKNNTISDWVLDPATNLWKQLFFYADSAAAGTSPSAMMLNGTPHVFFVDATQGKTISDWTLGSTWTLIPFYGDVVTAGSSPSAVNANGRVEVYFSDASKSNSVTDWIWSSSGIGQAFLYGDALTPGSSPSVVMNGPTVHAYLSDASKGNTLSVWKWNSSGVEQIPFYGDPLTVGSSPSAVMNGNTDLVFFSDAAKSNTVAVWTWSASSVQQTFFYGDAVAAGSSPSGMIIG